MYFNLHFLGGVFAGMGLDRENNESPPIEILTIDTLH
jgi:hypothetical protein